MNISGVGIGMLMGPGGLILTIGSPILGGIALIQLRKRRSLFRRDINERQIKIFNARVAFLRGRKYLTIGMPPKPLNCRQSITDQITTLDENTTVNCRVSACAEYIFAIEVSSTPEREWSADAIPSDWKPD